jgi:hypothetical protein
VSETRLEEQLRLIQHRNGLRLTIAKSRRLGLDVSHLEKELRCEEALDRETFPDLVRKVDPEEVLQAGETRAGYHREKGRVRLTQAKAWASNRSQFFDSKKGNT